MSETPHTQYLDSETTGGLEKNLADWAQVVSPAVRQSVERLTDPVKTGVLTHFGWEAPAGHAVGHPGSGGKWLRGTLTLLCCQAMGGQQADGLPAAVAVELIHNATLIHDDIIDQDEIRRGRPSLWVNLGLPTAILTGDALFFLAVEVLARAGGLLQVDGVGLLVAAMQEMIDGELKDTLFERHERVAFAEVQAMSRSKTASLVAVACELGGLAAGVDGERADHLAAFGRLIGEAFQATDDLLGIWGNQLRTGKPVRSDLRRRKKTLPVSYALASRTSAGQELAALYSDTAPLTDSDVVRAAKLIEVAGGREWVWRHADECANGALHHLAMANPEPEFARQLSRLVPLLSRRDF